MVDKKLKFWNEKIPFLKKLKEFFLKSNHNGINLWPIMAGESYTYNTFSEKSRLKRFLMVLKLIFFKENFKLKSEKDKIWATFFMPRDDHQELVAKAIEKFSKKELLFLNACEYKKQKALLKGRLTFPDFSLIFKIWKQFKDAKLKKTLQENYLFFIARTYQRCKQIDYFTNQIEKYNPKAHIAFCPSAFGEEAVITSIMKKQKKPTFTLQHGFFYNSPKNFASQAVVSENVISDYSLLWGKTSYDHQKKYLDKSRLILAGNPKYSLKDVRKLKKFAPKTATFFFSVTGYEESNASIVKIINEFAKKYPKIRFNMKIHPFDEIDNYTQYITQENIKFVGKNVPIKELLETSDFVILHNTSVTYEALIYRIPMMRFVDKVAENLWEKVDTFKNLDEFEKLFKNLENPKKFKDMMRFYDKKFKANLYFHAKKEPSTVYYEEIMKRIKP
ncbi:hypothetical protein GOV14_06915 [Candidatus Pacearchaeota archaeon]|nr:hypothetical protein [Candidatus Pacearchaeota archaeon]